MHTNPCRAFHCVQGRSKHPCVTLSANPTVWCRQRAASFKGSSMCRHTTSCMRCSGASCCRFKLLQRCVEKTNRRQSILQTATSGAHHAVETNPTTYPDTQTETHTQAHTQPPPCHTSGHTTRHRATNLLLITNKPTNSTHGGRNTRHQGLFCLCPHAFKYIVTSAQSSHVTIKGHKPTQGATPPTTPTRNKAVLVRSAVRWEKGRNIYVRISWGAPPLLLRHATSSHRHAEVAGTGCAGAIQEA